MGKYMRKCKEIGEVAVMEMAQLGVRMTRARAALAMAATAQKNVSGGKSKRKKVSGGKLELSSSSLTQIRRRRRVSVTPENSLSPETSVNSTRPETSNVPNPRSDRVIASCCSSNGSSELANEIVKFVDLEEESPEIETSRSEFNCRERERALIRTKEMSREESGEPESTARRSEAQFPGRSTVEKMPSEAELEEFFVAAEQDLHKRFTQKYNFDIVKDVPLEGRYEWVEVQLKQ